MKKTKVWTFRAIATDVAIVILALVCAILVLNSNQRRASVRATELHEARESEEAVLQKRQIGGAIYQHLKANIHQALPGFACWGDQCMVGDDKYNLPSALEKAIQRHLCDGLAAEFTRYADLKVPLSHLIPVHNLGFPGEGLTEVAARSGATGLSIGESFAIRGDTQPVAVVLTDSDGRVLQLNGDNNARMGRVHISDISGYFYPGSKAVDRRNASLSFGRELGGEPRQIEAGTPVMMDAADRFTPCMPILFFRETAGVEDATAAVRLMDAIVRRHDAAKGRCIVICSTSSESAIDRALKATFGEQYIRCDYTDEYMRDGACDALAERILAYLDMQGALEGARTEIGIAREQLKALSEGRLQSVDDLA